MSAASAASASSRQNGQGGGGGGSSGGSGDDRVYPYSAVHCAVLSNTISQEPRERVTFEELCDLIVLSKGFFKITEFCCAAPGSYERRANSHSRATTAWRDRT